jgi:hypothetical protein
MRGSRRLHHDETGPLKVTDQSFGCDPRHRIGRVMHPLAAVVAQYEGERGGDFVGGRGTERRWRVGHAGCYRMTEEPIKNVIQLLAGSVVPLAMGRFSRFAAAMPVTVNRAPVLTLWAAVVAERLGHPPDTALTLGRSVAGSAARVKARNIRLPERPASHRHQSYE